jgi:hypothetical protein
MEFDKCILQFRLRYKYLDAASVNDWPIYIVKSINEGMFVSNSVALVC